MARNSYLIPNADFHGHLNTFAALSSSVYKKLPYKEYRSLRAIKDSPVRVNFYKFPNGNVQVQISANGERVHTSFITDESFGKYLYNSENMLTDFKENDEMHHDEKPVYDIYGNTVNGYAETCKAEVCNSYDSLTSTSSWLNGNGSATTKTISINDAIGDIYAQTKAEVEIENVKQDLDVVSARAYKNEKEIDTLQHSIEKIVHEINNVECQLSEKANLSDLYSKFDRLSEAIENLRYDSMDVMDVHIGELRDCTDSLHSRIEQLEKKYKEAAIVQVQSTSSNCYPKKSFKINVAGWDTPCSDDRKEKENMDTNKMFAGFDFGPVDERIKMSVYGMAIRNADGRYVSYDVKTRNIVDVEVFNFENHNLIFKMPVAVSAIAVGDTIIHMKKPMFVTGVENGITAIDIFNGEVKTIMPATNMFGFNFVTKVVSLFNFSGANAPTAENPFGNMIPFMLMSDNYDGDNSDMFMMMAMMNGMNMGNMAMNPMMMYCMMGDSEMKKLLPFMLMGDQFNQMMNAAPAHNCGCGNHAEGQCHNHQ